MLAGPTLGGKRKRKLSGGYGDKCLLWMESKKAKRQRFEMKKAHVTVKFPFTPPNTTELERLLRTYDGQSLVDSPDLCRHKAGYRLDVDLLAKKMALASLSPQAARARFLRALVVTARQVPARITEGSSTRGTPAMPVRTQLQPAIPKVRPRQRHDLSYYESKAALRPFSIAPQPGNRYILEERRLMRFEPGAAEPTQIWDLPT